MRKGKMIVAIMMIITLLMGTITSNATADYSDIAHGDWYCQHINKATALGIIAGYPDGTFRPQNAVTYAEFVTMAMRGVKTPNTRGMTEWYAPYYYAAVDNGIFSEGEIAYTAISKPIPRGDMAVIMAGILAYNDLDGVKTDNAANTFSDISVISKYEYPVSLCYYYGMLSGYPD